MPADHWEAAQEGAELLREGEREAAIAELERVIAAQPENEYAYHYLGAAHYEAGDFMKAMKGYLRAIELAPKYLAALVGLGHTLRMLGRLDDAIKTGKQVLALASEDQDALWLLALAYYARGDNALSRGHLERFLETRPEAEAAMEAQGLLQVMRGEVVPLRPGNED
jgi:tetratricopeptide (TPR) repeat protein